jgi:hypothetical protein
VREKRGAHAGADGRDVVDGRVLEGRDVRHRVVVVLCASAQEARGG